jgi:hypothetical protein
MNFAPASRGVVDDGEVARALLDQPVDQRARLADLREPRNQNGRAVLDPRHRFGDRADKFIDHARALKRLPVPI